MKKPDREIRLDPLTVKLYEVEHPHGYQLVVVGLEQTLRPVGGGVPTTQAFKCDLDRLEAVIAHGQELRTRFLSEAPRPFNPKQPLSVFEHGTWTARFFDRTDREGERDVAIRIEHRVSEDGEPRGFASTLRRLEKVGEVAHAFEQERGHKREWSLVVAFAGLAEQEGLVRVHVVACDREKPARELADRNPEYDVLPNASRRRIVEGGYTLTVAAASVPKLGPDIHFHEAELLRNGPDFLLGEWYEKGWDARAGTEVKWDSGRDAKSREPRPYRIVPVGTQKPQGPGEVPITVLVEKDNVNFPPRHRIAETFIDPSRGEARFLELQGPGPRRERGIEQQQAKSVELSQAAMPEGYRPRKLS